MKRLLLAAILTGCLGCYTKTNLPPGVTADNIRRIEMGMDRSQVEQILGPPVAVDTNDPRFVGGETLVYSRKLGRLKKYSMLWVHLKNDEVVDVHAKRHNWITEEDIYIRNPTYRGGPGYETDRFASSFP